MVTNADRRYWGEFTGIEDITSEYFENGEKPDIKDTEVLFASLWSGGYEEGMIVVFERDGQLLVAESSHCSCNGFEWCPAPITFGALAMERLSCHEPEAREALHALCAARKDQRV